MRAILSIPKFAKLWVLYGLGPLPRGSSFASVMAHLAKQRAPPPELLRECHQEAAHAADSGGGGQNCAIHYFAKVIENSVTIQKDGRTLGLGEAFRLQKRQKCEHKCTTGLCKELKQNWRMVEGEVGLFIKPEMCQKANTFSVSEFLVQGTYHDESTMPNSVCHECVNWRIRMNKMDNKPVSETILKENPEYHTRITKMWEEVTFSHAPVVALYCTHMESTNGTAVCRPINIEVSMTVNCPATRDRLELIAVVMAIRAKDSVHLDAGHYCAFVKGKGCWIKFDDEDVTALADDWHQLVNFGMSKRCVYLPSVLVYVREE